MGRRDFYSLLPGLSSEIGHLYHYHIAVQKAVKSIGWHFTAFIPKKTKISLFPENWQPFLANDSWEIKKNVIFRLKILFLNIVKFRSLFKKIQDNKQAIVFIEHFELQHLASLFVSFFFLKPKFEFWILHRYAYGDRHFKTKIYKVFHWFLEKKFGEKKVIYLTDSELLAQAQEKSFNRSIRVVPIPHTQEFSRSVIKNKGQEPFLLWWPGGSIREDKGLSVIRNLIKLLKGRTEVKIVMAEKARDFLGNPAEVVFIPTVLSRGEYLTWMEKANLVLLPYSSEDYSKRTSGIFVEAVSSGTIPVVTQGTWMAYELNKFGLSRLVFSWKEEALIDLLCKLSSDPQGKDLLTQMADHYCLFHSEKGFSAALQKFTYSY